MLDGAAKRLIIVSGLLLVLAGFSELRTRSLHAQAAEVAERSRVEARAYAESFEDEHQQKELRLLDQRRELAVSAMRWRVTGSLALLFSLLGLLASWVLRQVARAGLEMEIEGPEEHRRR